MSRRKFGVFSRSAVLTADGNWDEVRRFNSVLRRLEKCKVTKVKMADHLAESKIAWKAAVLQQALLYRTVELASGCAKMWNLGNVLCSVLATRALLETIALTLHFETKLKEHHTKGDFESLDNLITSLTFATRDENFISAAPETAAKNVLTYIDRLSRKISLIREHYDSLSEWCHPNGYGHYFTFGSLDRDTGTVSFSKHKLQIQGMLDHILAVYMLLGLFENVMGRLDSLVRDISRAHSAAFPVR